MTHNLQILVSEYCKKQLNNPNRWNYCFMCCARIPISVDLKADFSIRLIALWSICRLRFRTGFLNRFAIYNKNFSKHSTETVSVYVYKMLYEHCSFTRNSRNILFNILNVCKFIIYIIHPYIHICLSCLGYVFINAGIKKRNTETILFYAFEGMRTH